MHGALSAYMVTGKRLPVHQDLVLSRRWLIKAREQEMEVHGQRPHCRNLFWCCSDDLGHGLSRLLRQQLPLLERGSFKVGEMATNTNRRPCIQLCL